MGKRKTKLSDIPVFPKRPTFRVTDSEGNEINPGDTVTDFRGETATFRAVSREPVGHKEAKVITDERLGEQYASVYKLNVEIVNEES
jgi:hypothetical protein